jgi:methyl-accepting chemotaxis protein
VADGGRDIATILETVDEASQRTTAELESIRDASRALAATSRRLQEAVSVR